MQYSTVPLPQLTGSAKQIAWAEQLRQRFLQEAQHLRDSIETGTIQWVAPTFKVQALAILDRIIPQSLAQCKNAATWINGGLGQSAEKLFVNAAKKKGATP